MFTEKYYHISRKKRIQKTLTTKTAKNLKLVNFLSPTRRIVFFFFWETSNWYLAEKDALIGCRQDTRFGCWKDMAIEVLVVQQLVVEWAHFRHATRYQVALSLAIPTTLRKTNYSNYSTPPNPFKITVPIDLLNINWFKFMFGEYPNEDDREKWIIVW